MQPVSLKLEPELHQRLQQCSELVGIKKTTLMIACLEALCDMIERDGGALVVPMRMKWTDNMDATHVPTLNPRAATVVPLVDVSLNDAPAAETAPLPSPIAHTVYRIKKQRRKGKTSGKPIRSGVKLLG